MSSNLIALQNKFLGQGTTVYDRLSILHAENGFITDEDIRALAEQYNLPAALVRSTAKFYEELRHSTPAGRVVKVCNGEACRAAPRGGSDALEARLSGVLVGGKEEEGSPGPRLEHVACLGYCELRQER